MLGKDHINISLAIVFVFVVPLIFLSVIDVLYPLVFVMFVIIGSLVPDTDCKGKATIYYRFPIIDWFMRKVIGKPIIFVFNHLISKKKIKVEHDVKDEHRGIIHSPIGVLISSLMLMIPIIIVGLFFNLFNIFVILMIFFGLLFGQILHLFEDSCTISGINWLFPFGTRELKGKIYTFSRDPERKDIRPTLYAGMFYVLSIGLALLYSFDMIKINLFLTYFLIVIIEVLLLIIMFFLSKSHNSIWLRRRSTINKINKTFRVKHPKKVI